MSNCETFEYYETEVTMPPWEISDPFGRRAIRKARFEFLQVKAERDCLKTKLLGIYEDRDKAVDRLFSAVESQQSMTAELNRRLGVCDEARKSLGEKLKAVTEERDDLQRRLQHEHELYQELLKEYAKLEDDHEALLRSVTDKHAEVSA